MGPAHAGSVQMIGYKDFNWDADLSSVESRLGRSKQNNAIFLPKREERMSVEDKAVLVLAVLGLSILSSLSWTACQCLPIWLKTKKLGLFKRVLQFPGLVRKMIFFAKKINLTIVGWGWGGNSVKIWNQVRRDYAAAFEPWMPGWWRLENSNAPDTRTGGLLYKDSI